MLNLSIIIPTRNRSEFLNKTLESITNQTMNKSLFEVIIVDNGSTDNTKKIISDYIDKLNIKYLYEPKLGLHEGRHTGLKNASCEILVYIDDDIEAFPEWLQTIQNVFDTQWRDNEKARIIDKKQSNKFRKGSEEHKQLALFFLHS